MCSSLYSMYMFIYIYMYVRMWLCPRSGQDGSGFGPNLGSFTDRLHIPQSCHATRCPSNDLYCGSLKGAHMYIYDD